MNPPQVDINNSVPIERWRQKTIIVEAIQFNSADSLAKIKAFMGDRFHCSETKEGHPYLAIETLDGKVFANPGDWIIRGANNEFSSCRSDIFFKSYDKVIDNPPQQSMSIGESDGGLRGMKFFRNDIIELLSKYAIGNMSSTNEAVLADMLIGTIDTWNITIRASNSYKHSQNKESIDKLINLKGI